MAGTIFNSGYAIEHERRDVLVATAMPFLLEFDRSDAPAEMDPRDWHRIEMQGSMGSCQGHALSSVVEMAFHIATGEVTQLSPLFAYYQTQAIDGLQGSDRGSTIDGGRRCAQEYGICPLEVMPYPDPVVYRWHVPEAAKKAGLDYRIARHCMCRSYDDVYRFLASGQGGVEIGIAWSQAMEPVNGVVERWYPGGGGHAVSFLGYSRRLDSRGRNYLWLANSWSIRWGNQGWAEVAPGVVDQMCGNSNTVMIGISDMLNAKPRRVNWAKEKVWSLAS